jgi:hypothetical protein
MTSSMSLANRPPGGIECRMSPEEHREMAQHEADLDLDHKDVRHLLYDIHDESLRRGRPFLEIQTHANKRIASLSARIAMMQQEASQELLKASNQILEASKEGTRTEAAYAEKAQVLAQELNASNKRSASLLDAINNFITAQHTEAARTQRSVDRLNRWMLGFTIVGSLFAALSIWISWQSLDLQKREIEQKNKSVSSDQANDMARDISTAKPANNDAEQPSPRPEQTPSPQVNPKPPPVPDSKENL